MEAYRQIWNNFGHYLRDVWGIKNFENVESQHVEDYIESKIIDGASKQYIEKISSAFSKLEVALTQFSAQYSRASEVYDFKNKIKVIARHKKSGKIEKNYHNRAYIHPQKIIDNLSNPLFKLAAIIQCDGGTRFKGVRKIKMSQMKGTKIDEITGRFVGIIETKEKGGRVGDVLVEIDTYASLEKVLLRENEFRIDYGKYAKSIRDTCELLDVECHGSHGFRWNFAKRRFVEYQHVGYGYDESLSKVSTEMKHNRTYITEHYLG
jgi:hypothetical protein